MRKTLFAALLASALTVPSAYAQQAQGGHDAHHPSAALSDGEVRKVDKDAKKITIKHGPLANLDMPAMTMVFQVADPAMLEQVRAGDKVKFEAEKIGGGYRITKIARAN
jgi:Cu(I)/Ag(I) efflux system periplasmic protein CusF